MSCISGRGLMEKTRCLFNTDMIREQGGERERESCTKDGDMGIHDFCHDMVKQSIRVDSLHLLLGIHMRTSEVNFLATVH